MKKQVFDQSIPRGSLSEAQHWEARLPVRNLRGSRISMTRGLARSQQHWKDLTRHWAMAFLATATIPAAAAAAGRSVSPRRHWAMNAEKAWNGRALADRDGYDAGGIRTMGQKGKPTFGNELIREMASCLTHPVLMGTDEGRSAPREFVGYDWDPSFVAGKPLPDGVYQESDLEFVTNCVAAQVAEIMDIARQCWETVRTMRGTDGKVTIERWGKESSQWTIRPTNNFNGRWLVTNRESEWNVTGALPPFAVSVGEVMALEELWAEHGIRNFAFKWAEVGPKTAVGPRIIQHTNFRSKGDVTTIVSRVLRESIKTYLKERGNVGIANARRRDPPALSLVGHFIGKEEELVEAQEVVKNWFDPVFVAKFVLSQQEEAKARVTSIEQELALLRKDTQEVATND